MKSIDSKPLISVIICTYNRIDLLKNALLSLERQTLKKRIFEVVLVNNGAKKNQQKIERLLKILTFRLKIKVIKEERLGLGFARNAGLREACGTFVAFLDDDAKAERRWLETALNYFKKVKPSPAVVGGPIYPFYTDKKPVWFKNEYESRYWGKLGRFLKDGESFSGSNMIFKKEVFDKYGFFDEEVGMRGNILSVGEETRLFETIWGNSKKSKLYYCPEVIVYHLVHPYKMNVVYNLKRWFASGQSYYLRNKNEKLSTQLKNAIKVTGYFFFVLGVAMLFYFRHKYFQNWMIERIGPVFFAIGYLCSLLGIPVYM